MNSNTFHPSARNVVNFTSGVSAIAQTTLSPSKFQEYNIIRHFNGQPVPNRNYAVRTHVPCHSTVAAYNNSVNAMKAASNL